MNRICPSAKGQEDDKWFVPKMDSTDTSNVAAIDSQVSPGTTEYSKSKSEASVVAGVKIEEPFCVTIGIAVEIGLTSATGAILGCRAVIFTRIIATPRTIATRQPPMV